MNLLPKASLIALLVLPQSVFAAVQITEIMYDVSGTDAGREWIEVTNTGGTAIGISGFKLFEANTNHALTVESGTGVLQPGVSAIIADDPAKFKIDWPSFGGTLLDSSFSLSNTGETLIIKDGTLAVHDSVTYDAGSGAAGDGQSLQRSGATFVSASPTPGSYSAGAAAEPTVPSSNGAVSSTPEPPPPVSSSGPVPITLRIQADDTVMVGGGSFFEAQTFGTQGLPLPARVIWNFGDGTVAEGARVFHAYSYPGRYAVVATAAYNYSATVSHFTVEAVAALVGLRAEGDGSLVVQNQSKKDLQLGLWSLTQGSVRFVIPDDTVVLAGEGVRFAPGIIGFIADTSAALRYPNDAVAATATVGATSPLRGERVPAPAVTHSTVAPVAPETRAPDVDAYQNESQGAVVQNAASPDGAAPWWPLVVLVAVLGVGAAGAWYVGTATRAATSALAEEFQIDE